MKKALLIVDMQNDFIDGTLGTEEARAIVPNVLKKMQEFEGNIIYTQDTHTANYLDTQEGKKLPVEHCIKGTKGWELQEDIGNFCKEHGCKGIEKVTFGSSALPLILRGMYPDGLDELVIVGLCTDICVISNAMLIKAFYPELQVTVDQTCCAGVTHKSHENALEAMRMCQIQIL